jgi:P-aminobenzoate N-oxygenase AurF
MPPALVHTLNVDSLPYHDPLGKLNWEGVARDAWWLPPEALSLAGVPAFERLPLTERQRLSHYEFAHLLETGIWLESLFIARLGRGLDETADPALKCRYLHEIREEAGHSLMFLELMSRSGVSIPDARAHRPRMARHIGQHAPADGLLFWTTVLAGEELPNRMNAMVRAGVEQSIVSAVVYRMVDLHMRDEARHIAYARTTVASLAREASPLRKRLASTLLGMVLDQFARHMFYPPPAVYRLAFAENSASAGMNGATWAALAAASATRRALVGQSLQPTLAFLDRLGMGVRSRYA